MCSQLAAAPASSDDYSPIPGEMKQRCLMNQVESLHSCSTRADLKHLRNSGGMHLGLGWAATD